MFRWLWWAWAFEFVVWFLICVSLILRWMHRGFAQGLLSLLAVSQCHILSSLTWALPSLLAVKHHTVKPDRTNCKDPRSSSRLPACSSCQSMHQPLPQLAHSAAGSECLAPACTAILQSLLSLLAFSLRAAPPCKDIGINHVTDTSSMLDGAACRLCCWMGTLHTGHLSLPVLCQPPFCKKDPLLHVGPTC